MSIGSIGSLAFAYSSTPKPIDLPTERRSGVAEPSAWSYLTGGDRDLIAAMFGPDALSNSYDENGKAIEIPRLAAVLIDDRKSGRLSTGVEVTSTYLQAMWDRYESQTGFTVANPLTPQNLTDGLAFLGGRSQGGAVDLRA